MWWLFVLSLLFFTVRSLRAARAGRGIPFVHEECCAIKPFPLWARAVSLFSCALSFLFLIFALAHSIIGEGPVDRFFQKSLFTPLPQTSSRVVSFVIDQSGSMGEPMPGEEARSKMYVVQQALQKCVAEMDVDGKGTDLISLVAFARAARVEVPLSRDRDLFFSALFSLVPESNPSLNGTAIGYAVFKTVRLILACKAFASETGKRDVFPRRSMIVVTDGLEEPNPADRNHPFRSMGVQQALENAASGHVSVYYINVDRNSYRMMREEERETLSSSVRQTGGKYFEVSPGGSLNQILQEIVTKERVAVPFSDENHISFGFWLVLGAMIALSFSRLFETAIMRVTR